MSESPFSPTLCISPSHPSALVTAVSSPSDGTEAASLPPVPPLSPPSAPASPIRASSAAFSASSLAFRSRCSARYSSALSGATTIGTYSRSLSFAVSPFCGVYGIFAHSGIPSVRVSACSFPSPHFINVMFVTGIFLFSSLFVCTMYAFSCLLIALPSRRRRGKTFPFSPKTA